MDIILFVAISESDSSESFGFVLFTVTPEIIRSHGGNSSLHISFHPIYQATTPSHKIRIAIRNHRRDTKTITIQIRLNEAHRKFVTDSKVVRECARAKGRSREEKNAWM